MNLVDGRFLDSGECDGILDTLDQRILDTLASGSLDPEIVISACDRLVNTFDEKYYLQIMAEFGIDSALGRGYIDQSRRMFCEEALKTRLSVELGQNYAKPATYSPLFSEREVTEQIHPLGVLLHVAAGNADGLPAFSVLEGLLTGNINILKLPAAEGGISATLLAELIKIEPRLSRYIYVFDYSSRDVENVSKLIAAADAVVVWGGDSAVAALRGLVKPSIKLIEWGHKVSFGYVTRQGMTESGLRGLALNIRQTGQLLCSSCQGIFVDTSEMEDVFDFCTRFLPILEEVYAQNPPNTGIGLKSQITLQLYAEELETIYRDSRVYRGRQCSLIAYPDNSPEPAIQFGNAWVKPLPQADLLSVLRPYKNHLQTAGLLCDESEREKLSRILWKTGVVRVCSGENMSTTYCGAAHDGEYSLRRYTKIVSTEL